MSMSDWIQRCSEAQQAGSPWPEAALLRAVVIHDDWSVSRSGGNTDAYCTPSAAPKGADRETREGLALAAALTQGGSIRLHCALGATPLSLSPVQASHLQLFVQIRVVEQILSLVHQGAELPLSQPYARLRDFESYYVVQQGSLLALAPDGNSRRLAAAFTAEDALQRFVAARDASGVEELIAARLNGIELFGKLADADLDGVVFNPAGPGQPVPLLKAFAQHVLSAS